MLSGIVGRLAAMVRLMSSWKRLGVYWVGESHVSARGLRGVDMCTDGLVGVNRCRGMGWCVLCLLRLGSMH